MLWETNKVILTYLNSFIVENNLQNIIGYLSDLPIFFIPLFLILAWFYYTFKEKNDNKKKDLILIFFASVVGVFINLLIQYFINIPRPEMYVKPILEHVPDASFPSDHAVVSFAFLFSLYLFGYKKTFFLYLPFVVLMNFSRIAGGIHWFWDVIAGLIIAILVSLIIFKLRNSSFIVNFTSFFIKLAKTFKL